MNYIAHWDARTGKEESVSAHLSETAKRAAEFAEAFGASDLGFLCGLLHDIGKYSDSFQRRIRGSSEKVDHSTAGALEAKRLKNIPAAFCIAGHHGGLPDGGNKKGETPDSPTLFGKLSRIPGKDIDDYSAFKSEIEVTEADVPEIFKKDSQSAFFFIRMLYSCLVDADYLDTEEFMSGEAVERPVGKDLKYLVKRLADYVSSWEKPTSKLNQKRCQILNAVTDKAAFCRGLFTLTVPTGGGKTVSSMAFALNHAHANNMRRVIYVIPYTSIIEQTQVVFEKIFGIENVVAHYANVVYNTDEYVQSNDKRYLAAENWDSPIILTTNVQFFESLYGNRSSKCRKLHNIAGSVIIFDEAQMLPVPFLRPCVAAVSQLVKNYGCSAVLCTATQPALSSLFRDALPKFEPIELCPDVNEMYDFFRRVCYQNVGFLTDELLAERLSAQKQVLCVVNNRKQAQYIFSLLDKNGAYHLSTTMYPAHRRRILAEIRQKLIEGKPCRVVSTSLIEAGVDVDFPAVYRAYAGLDSMIQAGGRCNREGKRRPEDSVVYLFESERKAPEIIRQNISSAERVIREYEDIGSPEAIKEYFDFLYFKLKDVQSLDMNNILSEIDSGSMPFASVAERFKIIESSGFTLYIPLEEGAGLIEKFREYGPTKKLVRQLGQYSVNLYPRHFTELVMSGAAEKLTENTAALCDLSHYCQETGLSFSVNEGQGFII